MATLRNMFLQARLLFLLLAQQPLSRQQQGRWVLSDCPPGLTQCRQFILVADEITIKGSFWS